jgi:hypothetical protein
MWGNHGNMHYSLKSSQDEAEAFLTSKKSFMRYELGSRMRFPMTAPWVLKAWREPKPTETPAQHAAAILNGEDSTGDLALELLTKGTLEPVEVIRFTRMRCPSCDKEMRVFEE